MIWRTSYAGVPIEVVGSPIRLSETPLVEPAPVPELGEHTESVLREHLGYDDEQKMIEDFIAR